MKSSTEESTRLIDQILEVRSSGANNYDSLSLLYQRIYAFLVYKNKQLGVSLLGKNAQSGQDTINREVNAALESVIPRNALSPFIMLTNPEKATQLSELNNLVLGIRLFNKEIGKGGQSLQTIKNLSEKLDPEFVESIRRCIADTSNRVDDYENYLLYVLENSIDEPNFEILKTELIFFRQFVAFALSLYEKTETSLNTIETAESRFLKEIDDLRKLLANNSSAPKEQVYPKFSTLANSYLTLVEESRGVDGKKQLFECLIDSLKDAQFTLTEVQAINSQKFAQLALEREEMGEGGRFENKNGVYRIEPRNTPEFLQTPLDFAGFSISNLVDLPGLLINGRHNVGVFKFEDFMLVFHNLKDARRFSERPQYYIDRLYEVCRKYPALIMILKLEDYFRDRGIVLFDAKDDFRDATKTMSDVECQTERHINPGRWDHNYFWNEWELRKRAIQMANIRNMTTKGSQTADSIFKVDNETQVWLKKEAATMTGIEAGTNPIRPRNYITELREKTYTNQ